MRNINSSLAFLFLFYLCQACQPAPYQQGHNLYRFHCESCHMEDGSGLAGLIPSLETSKIIDSDSLICLIRNGLKVNPSTGQQMPANRTLSEVEITNIVNYLRSLYHPDKHAIKVSEVHELLGSCP